MKVYFWYAERNDKSALHTHLNQASGTVLEDCPENAFAEVLLQAREYLGNTKQFTIKQFYLVE